MFIVYTGDPNLLKHCFDTSVVWVGVCVCVKQACKQTVTCEITTCANASSYSDRLSLPLLLRVWKRCSDGKIMALNHQTFPQSKLKIENRSILMRECLHLLACPLLHCCIVVVAHCREEGESAKANLIFAFAPNSTTFILKHYLFLL